MKTTTTNTSPFAGIAKALRAGYSLVELLIVAGLLTLLATLAIPQIYNAFTKVGGAKSNDLVAEVASAKARSVVDAGGTATWDANNATEGARFTAIQNYLSVAGAPPTAVSQLTQNMGPSASLQINNSSTAPAVNNTSF